jgi:hypothetical protein
LLYRITENNNYNDYVLGAKTQLTVSKQYWTKQHNLKRIKDIEVSNKQTEINTELNTNININVNANIQEYIIPSSLHKYSSGIPIETSDKNKWLCNYSIPGHDINSEKHNYFSYYYYKYLYSIQKQNGGNAYLIKYKKKS